ncbi:MAG: RNA polymerase sigma-70 factor [Chitinophagaceae bacterium]
MNSYFQYSDKELFQMLAKSNESAFVELYNRYKDKLFGFAYRLSGSEDEAKDLVQEVFYKIWERRTLLYDKDVFGSYLYKMIHNFNIDHARGFAKTFLLQQELGITPENKTPAADAPLLQKEIETRLKASVERLPPRQREVYLLHNEKGLKHTEIAKVLGLSVSTVENHFCRAMENLRKYLNFEHYLLALLLVRLAI